MKYAALEVEGVAKIVPVLGCKTCPHVEHRDEDGTPVMYCRHSAKRRLTTNWAGPYHAKCPLPGRAENFTNEEQTTIANNPAGADGSQ